MPQVGRARDDAHRRAHFCFCFLFYFVLTRCSHRDGSLKREVAANPGKFILPDADLVPLLTMMRTSGRKVFLLTNSLWDYTNVVMNFLCGGKVGAEKTLDWLDLFDAVVTGSCKPAFFENEKGSTIFEVDTETCVLRNTDDGAPLAPVVRSTYPLLTHHPRLTHPLTGHTSFFVF